MSIHFTIFSLFTRGRRTGEQRRNGCSIKQRYWRCETPPSLLCTSGGTIGTLWPLLPPTPTRSTAVIAPSPVLAASNSSRSWFPLRPIPKPEKPRLEQSGQSRYSLNPPTCILLWTSIGRSRETPTCKHRDSLPALHYTPSDFNIIPTRGIHAI